MLNLNNFITIIPQRDATSEYYNKILQSNDLHSFEVSNSWDNQMQTGKIIISRKNKGWLIWDAKSGYENQKKDYPNAPDDAIVTEWATSIVGWMNKYIGEKDSELYDKANFKKDVTNFSGFSAENVEPVIKVGDFIALEAYYLTSDIFTKTQDIDFTKINILEDDIYKELQKNMKVYTKDSLKLDGIDQNLYDNDISKMVLSSNNQLELKYKSTRNQLFYGYITGVETDNDGRTVIKIADYMYYINQMIIKDDTYNPNKWDIASAFVDLYNDSIEKGKKYQQSPRVFYTTSYRIPLNPLFKDNTGKPLIRTINDRKMYAGIITTESHPTLGMFLKEIKSKYNCQPFFYANTNVLNFLPFRTTTTPYGTGEYPSLGYQQHYFCFQENIISHNLEFRRKEDRIIGVRVKAFRESKENVTTVNGSITVRKKPFTIYIDPGGDTIDMHTMTTIDPNKLNEKQLAEQLKSAGLAKLKKINYSGYYGSFTTFGYPYISHGDRVKLVDKIYPERNGVYTVKTVKYYGSADSGFRQTITIDYRIGDDFSDSSNYVDPERQNETKNLETQ